MTKFKLGQRVKIEDKFYDGMSGVVLEYRLNNISLQEAMNGAENQTLYLVEIIVHDKTIDRKIFHRIWIKEEDLENLENLEGLE